MPRAQIQARPTPGVTITNAIVRHMDNGSVVCIVTGCESFFHTAVTAVANDEEMEPNLIVEIDEAHAVLLARQALSLAPCNSNRVVIIDVSSFPTIGAYVLTRELTPGEDIYNHYQKLVDDECLVIMVNKKEHTICMRTYDVPH